MGPGTWHRGSAIVAGHNLPVGQVQATGQLQACITTGSTVHQQIGVCFLKDQLQLLSNRSALARTDHVDSGEMEKSVSAD